MCQLKWAAAVGSRQVQSQRHFRLKIEVCAFKQRHHTWQRPRYNPHYASNKPAAAIHPSTMKNSEWRSRKKYSHTYLIKNSREPLNDRFLSLINLLMHIVSSQSRYGLFHTAPMWNYRKCFDFLESRLLWLNLRAITVITKRNFKHSCLSSRNNGEFQFKRRGMASPASPSDRRRNHLRLLSSLPPPKRESVWNRGGGGN